jgi:hypothetical protein
MRRLLLVSVLFILSLPLILSQEPVCTVLVKNLQGTYIGDCKKGLAHGKGTAKGIDSYTGYFKKGYPHGKGTYSWAAGDQFEGFWQMGSKEGEGVFRTQIGGKDTIISGIWKDDKYIGPVPLKPEIILNNGAKSITFSRVGDGTTITFMFMQVGNNNSGLSDLITFGSSGTEFTNGPYMGYEKVSFPFTARITYQTQNAFKTGYTTCALEFKISQPGRWDVRINN